MDPPKEEENRAMPLGCEPEILVEEQATKVSVQKEDKVNNMDNKNSYFFSIHVHLQPFNPCKYKNSSLASEDCKRRPLVREINSPPPIGDHTISENKGDIVNGNNMVKEYFGSDPKEQEISDLNPSFEFPNEVESKHPPSGCELGNLKEKNLMQREGHSSECWTLLQHDEAEIPRHEMLSDFHIDHMSFQHSEIPSTLDHGSECAENSKDGLYVEDEFYVVDSCHKKNGHICYILGE